MSCHLLFPAKFLFASAHKIRIEFENLTQKLSSWACISILLCLIAPLLSPCGHHGGYGGCSSWCPSYDPPCRIRLLNNPIAMPLARHRGHPPEYHSERQPVGRGGGLHPSGHRPHRRSAGDPYVPERSRLLSFAPFYLNPQTVVRFQVALSAFWTIFFCFPPFFEKTLVKIVAPAFWGSNQWFYFAQILLVASFVLWLCLPCTIISPTLLLTAQKLKYLGNRNHRHSRTHFFLVHSCWSLRFWTWCPS